MTEAANLITDAELLQLGLPGAAISVVGITVRDEARAAASAEALSYVKKRATLPLLSWGSDLRRAVAHLATYDLMVYRGFDPGSESGALIVKRRDDAILWLRDVARGIVEPVDMVDSTETTDEAAPLVSSDEPGGWAWPTVASEVE